MTHYHIPGFIEQEQAEVIFHLFKYRVEWVTFAPSPNSRLVQGWDPKTFDPLVNQAILEMIEMLKKRCGVTECTSVFMNNYINGNDYCPYHRDLYETDVYTISLGSSRDFLIKKDEKGTKAIKYTLNPGDLYFMEKELNIDHKHSIPKRKNAEGMRISVVFFCKTSETFHYPNCDCSLCKEIRFEEEHSK